MLYNNCGIIVQHCGQSIRDGYNVKCDTRYLMK